MVNKGGVDFIFVKIFDVFDIYFVGIELEKVLVNLGLDFDMVLCEGDILFVLEYVSIVKINGVVMYFNIVLYKKGESLKYYINQVGGFVSFVKKKRVFVVYMNGIVFCLCMGNFKVIELGCEIIVLSKDLKKRMLVVEIIGMGIFVVLLVIMIVMMVNFFKQ